MIGRHVLGMLLAVAAFVATGATYNGVTYATEGDVVPGELTSRFTKARSYADSKNIPLVVVWANPGCGFCANFERSVLAKDKVLTWMADRKYVFVFCLGKDTSDGLSAWNYTLVKAYPMCRVHWKKNKAGKAVDLCFCGRTADMKNAAPGISGTLGERFMSLVDGLVGDYAGEGSESVAPAGDGKHTVSAMCDAAVGMITGTGDYAEGKKVTVRVSVKKGNEFLGWYDGETLLSQKTTYSFSMPAEDVSLTPRFLTAEEILSAITLSLGGKEIVAGTTPAKTVTQGVPVSWALAVDGASGVKVAVSGLPTGLKYNSKTGAIEGVPTLAKAATVKIRVTASSGASKEYRLSVTVDALPVWAKGNFYGFCATGDSVGRAVVSVASSGKVSGKVVVAGKKYALKASSLASREGKVLTLIATVSLKPTRSVSFTLSADGDLGRLTGLDDAGLEMNLLQNVWERKDLKPPVFPSGAKMLVVALDGGAVLKFGTKGAVKVGGNVGRVPVSGSSQLVAGFASGALTSYAQTVLSLTGRAFDGGYFGEVVDFRLKDSNRDGKVDVIVEEE